LQIKHQSIIVQLPENKDLFHQHRKKLKQSKERLIIANWE
jgi:hypothetical protein